MPQHPLHLAIGTCLVERVAGEGVQVVLDDACGGGQHVPLFLTLEKSSATEICDVDALIIADGRVAMVMEIEESNIKPTQICGKFLTVALAKYYIHEQAGNEPLPLQDVLFVQVVDSSRLKARTAKLDQFRNIEGAIKSLALAGVSVSDYWLVPVEGVGDASAIEAMCDEIAEYVMSASAGG